MADAITRQARASVYDGSWERAMKGERLTDRDLERMSDDQEIRQALRDSDAAGTNYEPTADGWMTAAGPESLPEEWSVELEDGTVLTRADLLDAEEGRNPPAPPQNPEDPDPTTR